MRVSLVGTVHAENGLANVVELQAILERLQPDVIFAEIPSTHLDRYRDGSHGTLESIAVSRYRESHEVAVVPVDLPEPEEQFFSNGRELFDAVERTSSRYCQLMDRHSLDVREGGFPYLNGERCLQALVDIRAEVLATVEWIRLPRFREIWALWNQTDELRDVAMMKNIEAHAASQAFAHGVFLVGTAHRKSIIEKTRAGREGSFAGIEWEVDGLAASSSTP